MVDGVGAGGITPKDLYNKVNGSKTEFIKQWQDENKGNPFMAEKIYNYVASMDTDGTPGLTPQEYRQGLTDKKSLATIKQAKIYDQYVPEEDRKAFAQMGQEEKLAYLESKIPHEPGREAEAHIQASLVLSSLNRLDTELMLLDQTLQELELQEDNPEKAKQMKLMKLQQNEMYKTTEKAMQQEEMEEMRRMQKETLEMLNNKNEQQEKKEKLPNNFGLA